MVWRRHAHAGQGRTVDAGPLSARFRSTAPRERFGAGRLAKRVAKPALDAFGRARTVYGEIPSRGARAMGIFCIRRGGLVVDDAPYRSFLDSGSSGSCTAGRAGGDVGGDARLAPADRGLAVGRNGFELVVRRFS